MGKSSGTDRGGFGGGDGTFRGEIKNARDLATIKDGAVYKEMKEGISRYHAVMGVRQRSVKIADLPDRWNGVHVTNGKGESEGIYLNSKVYDNPSRTKIRERVQSAYDSGWQQGRINLFSILSHTSWRTPHGIPTLGVRKLWQRVRRLWHSVNNGREIPRRKGTETIPRLM